MPLSLNQSIRQIGPSRWYFGSLVCERIITTMQYADAVAAWEEDECTYILRNTKDGGIATASFVDSSEELRLVHVGGSSSAVWTIGREAFCKVKAWNPEMETEDKTIAFIKKTAPQISTPEVIYAWTDHDRSFLILRRIKGSTLRDAWTSLSLSQRHSVVKSIATLCDILAQNTSQMLGSATGRPVLEPFLSPSDSGLLGLLTHNECKRYFSVSSDECPPLGRDFYFYHPDLGPGNIIVSDDGRVAGILDWEAAGYYPAFWIATKPSVSPGLDFYPPIAECDDHEWRKCLRMELERRGYPQASEWYIKWKTFR